MADIDIFGTLHNAVGGAIAKTEQVKDNALNKLQSELNAKFNAGQDKDGNQLGKTYVGGEGITVSNEPLSEGANSGKYPISLSSWVQQTLNRVATPDSTLQLATRLLGYRYKGVATGVIDGVTVIYVPNKGSAGDIYLQNTAEGDDIEVWEEDEMLNGAWAGYGLNVNDAYLLADSAELGGHLMYLTTTDGGAGRWADSGLRATDLEKIANIHSLVVLYSKICDLLDNKQNNIHDLVTIRSGAALGATALQSHQSLSNYYTKTETDNYNAITRAIVNAAIGEEQTQKVYPFTVDPAFLLIHEDEDFGLFNSNGDITIAEGSVLTISTSSSIAINTAIPAYIKFERDVVVNEETQQVVSKAYSMSGITTMVQGVHYTFVYKNGGFVFVSLRSLRDYVLDRMEDLAGVLGYRITFSESTAYYENQVVWKDGLTYQFTADKAAGPWNPNVVAQRSLLDVFNIFAAYNFDERVVVTVSSEVQGVNVEGLTINVYYNGSETIGDTIVTNANGVATLVVPHETRYKLVFPTLTGCKAVLPVAYMSTLTERAVTVEYVEPDAAPSEQVTVVLKNSSGGNVSGATVTYTIGNTTESVVTDSKGEAHFEVEIGTTYTVTAPTREGYFIAGNVYAHTQEADRSQRTWYYMYRTFIAGIGVVTADGTIYNSLEDFQEAVEGGLCQKSDAFLIRVATSTLQTKNGVFSMKISTIASDSLVSRQWSPNTTYRFTSIPENGSSTSSAYHYDGKTASELIQQEGDDPQVSIETPAVDYCLSQEITIDSVPYKGFLLAYGQMNALWSARDMIDQIIAYLNPSWRKLGIITTAKWTSTQSSASNAWYWATSANYNYKSSSFIVLPAFAY